MKGILASRNAGKFVAITGCRKGLVADELTHLTIEATPMKPRKNKSDRKRNRKQRWC